MGSTTLLTYFLVVVGYGCLCAWELTFMFSPVASFMGFAEPAQAVELYAVALASCTVAALALWRKADAVLERRRQMLPLGSILLLCALSAFTALTCTGARIPAVELAAAVLLGTGQALLLVLWGAYLSLVPPGRTAWAIALGSIVGTALFMLAINLGSAPLNLLGSALFVAVSAVSANVLASTLPEGSILPVDRYDKAPPLSSRACSRLRSTALRTASWWWLCSRLDSSPRSSGRCRARSAYS